ncbi:MAG: hypothetical protein R3A46_13445 [Thermomicrobiales bacterium]
MSEEKSIMGRIDWVWIKALAGPLCGMLFFLITFYSIGAGSAFSGQIDTGPNESGRLTATVLSRNAEDLETSARWGLVGLIFLFPFLGYLYRWLQRDDGEDGWLAPTAFAGGITTAAMIAVNLKLDLAVSMVNDYGEDFAAARALGVLAWSAHTATGASMAVLIAATGLAVLGSAREVTLPRWTGWLSLPLALIILAVSPWIRLLFLMIWVLVISGAFAWRVFDTPTVASVEDKSRP